MEVLEANPKCLEVQEISSVYLEVPETNLKV